jgi:diaminopimelate epimerase
MRELLLVSATGNRFALHDGFEAGALDDAGALALLLGEKDDLAVDGLLQLLPPTEGGDCRMVLHNLDGSRAEACGNGLRCVTRVALEREHASGESLVVETDTGPRRTEVLRTDGELTAVRACLGRPQVLDLFASLEVREGTVEAVLIELGNPHCVLFVPESTTVAVAAIGAQLETHPRFPERTNVEFVDARKDELRIRIWERGVGETRSCGTGVAAGAVAAILKERATSPVTVRTAGGTLVVTWEGEELLLEGPVEPIEGTVAFPLG